MKQFGSIKQEYIRGVPRACPYSQTCVQDTEQMNLNAISVVSSQVDFNLVQWSLRCSNGQLQLMQPGTNVQNDIYHFWLRSPLYPLTRHAYGRLKT